MEYLIMVYGKHPLGTHYRIPVVQRKELLEICCFDCLGTGYYYRYFLFSQMRIKEEEKTNHARRRETSEKVQGSE